MAKEIPSYKNRLNRICNKVQRMVDDLESSKQNHQRMPAKKKSLKQVVKDILLEGEETHDC